MSIFNQQTGILLKKWHYLPIHGNQEKEREDDRRDKKY